MSSLIELPLGSGRIVKIINRLEPKKFAQLSDRILERLPLDDPQSLFTFDEKQKLLPVFGVESSSDLAQLLVVSASLWRQIAFHCLESNAISDQLRQLGFTDDIATKGADIWNNSGQEVINRLKSYSGSQVSQLIDVNWTLNEDFASLNCAKLNQPMAKVELVCSNERLPIEMDHAQLANLFDKLEEVQQRLDVIMN
uniref:COMM domain-containing protein n=1 Tax=Plectus sambesii TaxID=2011161 RepID=A0A914V4M8_9BILA